MARVELPRTNLRARRRRRRLIVAAVFTIIGLLILAGLVGLSYLPFLKITTINVTGAQTLATSTVVAVADKHLQGAHWYLFTRRNIFLYSKQEIITALFKQYPTIKSIDVHAENFHTISIAVVERKPSAIFCPGHDQCYSMDEDGVIYAVETFGPRLVWYSQNINVSPLPKQFLTPEQFHNLSALVDALSQTEPTDPVEQVTVDSHGDVRARYQKGFELLFALKDASGDVFDRYTLAKKSPAFVGHTIEDFSYLDLRFGDKLYYKLKVQP